MAKPLRIFISSPGDVAAERRRAALIIEKLAKDYARFFEIVPYLWETEPMVATGHFQDAILPPGETDIVILIVWARLGTPLPEDRYHGIDGRVPVTGTEWEFEEALAAHEKRGAPDILSYKKRASPQAEYTSEKDLEGLRLQLRNLEAFWRRYFLDETGFRAAFSEFDSIDAFETKIESDLRALIEHRIDALGAAGSGGAVPTWLTGSPFRGLETYRFEHAPIFFGRSDATKTAVEHLVENAEAGRPFLLVLGASGSGKSSLVQAGVVPALHVRGVVPGVGGWRRAVVRPGGHPAGPFAALAAALTDENALPELIAGQDAAALARHLETAAADPAYPIVAALVAREQAAQQRNELLAIEQIRLILVVDQIEELFTLGELTPERRAAFVACLKGLMSSGRVLVIATMRSDYWHRAAETPLLVTLAEGHGRLDLLPPTQAEITEMIRRPAEVAGLTFETDHRTEIRLDAAIAEEAAHEPGALPLLSFLLEALYATDIQGGKGSTLHYASMLSLGGLKGAIATRAEAAFTALPADIQGALSKVLRTLVTVSRSGAEPTARPVPMSRFPDGTPERKIVDAFLDPHIRLLVADGDGDGARIRLAHEALITHWDRAKRQIAQDRDDLRTRAVVEQAHSEWTVADGGNKRGLLLRDPHLANAIDLARRWRDEFDPPTLDFIAASQRRARFMHRMILAAAAVLALTTVGASALGLIAYSARQTAEVQRNQALTAQGRFLADLSRQRRGDGDAVTATLLALEALGAGSSISRPKIPEAEFAVVESISNIREHLLLIGHIAELTSVAFSPDGKTILTAGDDRTVRLWNAQTGAPIAVMRGHQGVVMRSAFSPDGKRIVTPSYDKTVRLWNAETHAFIKIIARCSDAMQSAMFSPDGKRILTACSDKTAAVWDAETGALLLTLSGHEAPLFGAQYSYDGKFIVTASADKTARVWDAETGALIHVLSGHRDKVLDAAFSRDGKYIVTSSSDTTAEIWDAASGKPLGSFVGHQGPVSSAMFSTNGQRIATTSHDGSTRIWDTSSRQSVTIMAGHRGPLTQAAVSPDNLRIATASVDGTARVWNVGAQVTPVFSHSGPVVTARFSPDGQRIVTAVAAVAAIWNTTTGAYLGTLRGHASRVDSADYSPDGKSIVTTSYDKTARIWNAITTLQVGVLSGHEDMVAAAVFSPDGQRIATGSADRTLRVWDAVSGQQLAVLSGHTGGIASVAFSSDGTQILTASLDKTARLWDAKAFKPLTVLTGHDGFLTNAGFSPDGRFVVTASSDKTARVWDVSTGKTVMVLTGHQAELNDATFSPDGTLILTASSDNTARLWDAKTGALLRTLVGHQSPVVSARFSYDGKRIITGSGDRTARLWQTVEQSETNEQLIARAERSVPRCLMPQQRVAAFLDPQPPDWCIELGKWPYQTKEWKDWLAAERAGTNKPMPEVQD